MEKSDRTQYRAHQRHCALAIICILCIIAFGFALFKINSNIRKLNERLDILETRLAQMTTLRLAFENFESQISTTTNEEPNSENDIAERTIVDENENETKEVELPKLYSDEDVIVLTKMLYGEAGAVGSLNVNGKVISSKCQQAAVIWTVLNRYDTGYADTIVEIVTAKNQYVGYRASNPIDEELKLLVIDVLDRWTREKHGETDVGRVIPSDYIYFHGDGRYNYFRNTFEGGGSWTWELSDPYVN